MKEKHRIFIAINLPEEIKTVLSESQKKWPSIPARWTKPENIHITLVFVGYADEQGLEEIKQILADVAIKHNPFSISLTKISYGPPGITPPRMIWAIGEKSGEFASLCDNLGRTLSSLPKISFKPEDREVIPHITLARIKEWEWRRIEPDERPEIREYINFKIPVNSIELMESVLKRTGSEYKILETYSLGK